LTDTVAAQAWLDLLLAPWRAMAQTWPGVAPQTLLQPINPGWTFGNLIQVTEQNSTAPDTEQAIVRRHSYGRQLGRVMDAVDLLLERADHDTRADSRAQDFEALQHEVADIKRERASARLRSLRDELLNLRREQPEAWRELQALLRE
jgi:hypothetical protein